MEKINLQFPNIQRSKCLNHYIYIIELLFITKLFEECKLANSQIGRRNVQNAFKLRVLQYK